jgi:hypothetical protein
LVQEMIQFSIAYKPVFIDFIFSIFTISHDQNMDTYYGVPYQFYSLMSSLESPL